MKTVLLDPFQTVPLTFSLFFSTVLGQICYISISFGVKSKFHFHNLFQLKVMKQNLWGERDGGRPPPGRVCTFYLHKPPFMNSI